MSCETKMFEPLVVFENDWVPKTGVVLVVVSVVVPEEGSDNLTKWLGRDREARQGYTGTEEETRERGTHKREGEEK